MIINNGIRRLRWRWWLTGFSPFRTAAAASAILFSTRHRPPPSTDVRMRWRTDGCAVILSLKGNGTFRRYYCDSYTNHIPYTYPPSHSKPRAGDGAGYIPGEREAATADDGFFRWPFCVASIAIPVSCCTTAFVMS